MRTRLVVAGLLLSVVTGVLVAQAPAVAVDGVPLNAAGEPQYSTFSLCAIDPATGQSGAAVTTRVPFVGRAVPHVRAGVGAVCTQASTMVEFGKQGLDLIEKGTAPADIVQQLLASDERRETRQVGVIDMKGRSAAHTGTQNGAWAGSRQGLNYTVQANIMVGPEVIEAVAAQFESTEGLGMPAREYGAFDEETIAAVDKCRADNAMNYQGNPPGLVDARVVDALRAAYFKKRKGA